MALGISAVTPAPDSTGNPLQASIAVTFDRLVDTATVTASSFVVSRRVTVDVDHFMNQQSIAATTAIDGTISFTTIDSLYTRATFVSNEPLDINCQYTVILSTEITGADASVLAGIYSWGFQTGSGSIFAPPAAASDVAANPYFSTPVTLASGQPDPNLVVFRIIPEDRATNLLITTDTITITFNKAIDPDTLTDSCISIVSSAVDGSSDLNPAAGVLDYDYELDETDTILTITLDLDSTSLQNNNRVVLTLTDIVAADGNIMSEPFVSYFTTTYYPIYNTSILTRLQIGSYIKNVPDDTINLALYYASREADRRIPQASAYSDTFQQYVNYAKAEFVLYSACFNLMVNLPDLTFSHKTKTLGDMEVSWEQSKLVDKLIGTLQARRAAAEEVLHNLAFNPLGPQMAVKGALDNDRPLVGRDYTYDPFRAPIVNAQTVPSGSRRKVGNNSPFPPYRWRWETWP